MSALSLERRVWLPIAVAALCLLLASLARHRLVEPADLTATCDAAPWSDFACALRTLVIQAFAAQRLAVFALACALLATLTRSRALALAGLATGCAALVLYSVWLAAPAVLLAALVLARPRGSAA
jgi:uncharacterized membrane protein